MAVRALLHYALEVPDPGVGEKFYRNFGLVDASSQGDTVRLRPAPLKREAVLLFPPDPDRQIDFYTRALGMRLSDRSRSIVAFLRCTTDHHNLAFLASKGPGFHHGSFEVGSIDEIALGAQRMLDAGCEPGWGV